MSDLPEVTPDTTAETDGAEYADPSAQPRAEYGRLIPVSELTAHPGNVRQDLELSPEFCASIASEGVRVPLLVTFASDGTYRVIEGHRRLAAAVKTGLEAIPCDLDPDRAGDEAGQYLDMALANGGGYRRNFTVTEEAAALFAAHEAGASKTRLRKATGRKAEEIKTVLKVAQISEDTRTAAGDLTHQLDLESLALLAEFDGDPAPCHRSWTPCSAGTTWNIRLSGSASSAPKPPSTSSSSTNCRPRGCRSPPTCRPGRRGCPSCCTTAKTSPPRPTARARAGARSSTPGR